jgi:hypothetical protein
MTVYVDDMKAVYKPQHRPGRTYVMSHMIADTDDELHTMAVRIGVARKWFQGDHYDITQTKRAAAVKHGAVELDRRTLGAMAMLKRWGFEMGDPESAQARLSLARAFRHKTVAGKSAELLRIRASDALDLRRRV